jgi:hypothetical protein
VIVLTRQLNRRGDLAKAQRFAAVELAEVDRLRNVAIGFCPILTDFKDQPRHELEFAFAEQVAHAEDQAGALFDRGATP